MSFSTTGFLALPAELQINVYNRILNNVYKDPSPVRLNSYAGLLLSNKKINADFEHEWVNAMNFFLNDILKDIGLRALPVESMAHAAHIRILIANDKRDCHKAINKLLNTGLQRFTLCVDSPCPDTTSIEDFFKSYQWNRLKTLHYMIEGLNMYRRLQNGEVTKPRFFYHMDIWSQEVQCSRVRYRTVSFKVEHTAWMRRYGMEWRNTQLVRLPRGDRWLIYQYLLEDCNTMADVRRVCHGWWDVCPMLQHDLLNKLAVMHNRR